MSNQPESPVYDAGVYQLEVADPVQGGVGGVSNAPLLNLARRTAYLKQHMDALESSAAGFATLNSPALTGTPTTPTPALGDATQKIPSTDWVQKSIGGILSKSVAGASNVSLTTVEAGNGIFLFTGVITANIAVIVPTASKYWVVANRTTGNFSLTVKTAAGTGVVIPQGLAVVVYCDGTNVFLASSAGQASFTPYLFSPAAGTTSLSITNGYTPGCVMVEKNGALLRTSDYTATNGTTIVIPATVAVDQFTVYAFSSFSIANAVQKSGDVMAGPLSLFAGSTAPTPAQFDNDTSVATTEFVKRASGVYSGYSTIATSRTLIGDDIGTEIRGATAVTLTLPIPTSIGASNGDAFSVFANTGGIVTVASGSGVSLNYDNSGIGSASIKPGQSATFVVTGSSTWQMVNSTAELGRNADFEGTTTVNNYRRLPGGRILQEGTGLTDANGQLTITFPTAFIFSGTNFKIVAMHSGNSACIVTEVLLLRGLTGTTLQLYLPSGVVAGSGFTVFWIASGY